MNVLTKAEETELLKGLDGTEKIGKEASLSWDGSNLIVRIPKEIADYLNLTKANRFKKNIKFMIEEERGVVKKKFEIVDREKPRRITKENGNKEKPKKNSSNR